MYVMTHEVIVPIGDLRYLSLECFHCKTHIVLDMDVEIKATMIRSNASPLVCSMCDSPFDSAVSANLGLLRKAYKELSKQTLTPVSFRVKGDTSTGRC